jgi:uncharacterized protein YndB with AHSA1/START domain
MTTDTRERESIQTVEIRKEIEIAAPIQVAFDAMLAEIGPEGQMMDGAPFPKTLEPWPGGRWFRDLGNHTGHLWGHVQVFKPPTLLELTGPMFMSYPAINHVQYRLKEEGHKTRLTLVHRAAGLIAPEHEENMPKGWEHILGRIRQLAERKKGS